MNKLSNEEMDDLKNLINEITNSYIIETNKKLEKNNHLESKLMKYIINVENNIIQLRKDANIFELWKMIKTKAEIESFNKLVLEQQINQTNYIVFKKGMEKEVSKLTEAISQILPIFNELRNASALRQSNCLVCGRKTSSPEFEKQVHIPETLIKEEITDQAKSN